MGIAPTHSLLPACRVSAFSSPLSTFYFLAVRRAVAIPPGGISAPIAAARGGVRVWFLHSALFILHFCRPILPRFRQRFGCFDNGL